jgi:uncharacterized protein (DUF3084 family)
LYLVAAVEQHVALGVKHGDQELVVDSIAALKTELANEKQAWEKAQMDAETLSRAVEELKKMTDQLSAYVPSVEAQVKSMNGTIADLNTKLRTRELSLERINAAKDDFPCQSKWLTKKLEGTCPSHCCLSLSYVFHKPQSIPP